MSLVSACPLCEEAGSGAVASLEADLSVLVLVWPCS